MKISKKEIMKTIQLIHEDRGQVHRDIAERFKGLDVKFNELNESIKTLTTICQGMMTRIDVMEQERIDTYYKDGMGRG